MALLAAELVWVTVDNIHAAKDFYTKTLGFTIVEENLEFGWVEVQGPRGGYRIGLAQKNEYDAVKPGSNAVITITVDNLEKTIEDYKQKNVTLVGEVFEIPNNLKMISLIDQDGNHLQIVEMFNK